MSYTSPFAEVTIPEVDVFTHIFGNLSEEDAARPAITEVNTDTTITYGELRDRALSVAGALAQRGIGKGDVVALQIPNSINYATALLGIARSGATVSPLGALLNRSDLENLLKLSGAKLYIGTTDVEEMPQIFSGEIPPLAAKGFAAPDVDISPDDLFAIPFSSGTTGVSKGVMLTHSNIVSNIEQTGHMFIENEIPDHSNFLCPLPFTHIYGMTTQLLCQLAHGHQVFSMPKFDLDAFLGAHSKHKIVMTFIAPPLAVALAKHPAVKKEDFESSRLMISGAAPLDNELARAVEQRLDTNLVQGYGMTETSPVTHVGLKGKSQPGSIGFVVPNTEFKIFELESNNEVPEGEPGELTIRGPQVTKGYLNNEEATREALIGDGWLRTGDIARVDDDGTVYIVDRAKEVIKYKGYQVAPAELEALLLTHPDITDAGVVGVYRDGLEIPRAFVVKREGAELTESEIMRWVAERVTPYKKIRAVDFIDEIPKNPTGKILRRELRDIPFEG
ncbi:AMP-binding protein [Corynebacterium breve]|uniref:AMP-binding protein n=1 Tax=Corynebacterium breve TaxID=3049799 RepID=A0ABY8VGX9_9CORY|nr:AMP-binding protein [Corynebacterium breve]WIM68332.1 AMP-binding protein [Corynebacterium breve]